MPLAGRLRVQQLADVAQVGQPPLAVLGRAARARAGPRSSVIVSVSDATPRTAQHARPVVQAAVDRPPTRSSLADATCSALQPRNGGQRRRVRALVATSAARSPRAARSQSRAGAGAEHAARAVDDRGDVDRVERVAHERRVAVGAHQHGDVPGRTVSRRARSPSSARTSISAPDAEQRDEVGGQVLGDVLARDALLRVAAAACVPTLGSSRCDDPDAQRRALRGAPISRGAWLAVGRAHPAVDDALVAELRAAEQRVVGVDQPLVAAPVDVERRLRARPPARRRGRRRRRRRGRRRSPAWGRRSGRASRRRRRTRAA